MLMLYRGLNVIQGHSRLFEVIDNVRTEGHYEKDFWYLQ
jgi:hypothetical protein